MTLFEKWEALKAEIVRNEPPTVFESFSLDRSYAYGIGLCIVLDAEVVDRTAIPVPQVRLPGVLDGIVFRGNNVQ
jgi:hypothetical protein